MNKRNILSRILVSPIILALLLVTYLYGCLKHFVKYIRYGGEWLTYDKTDRRSMDDIFKILKEKNKLND